MDELTLARTLDAVRDFRASRGRSPTCKELATEMGCSLTVAHKRVRELISLGIVRPGVHTWRLSVIPEVENYPVRVSDVRDVLATVDLPPSTVNSVISRLIGLSLEDAAALNTARRPK